MSGSTDMIGTSPDANSPIARSPVLKRAGSVFSNIDLLASAIGTLCEDIVRDATDNETAHRAVAAKAMADQISLLAEIGQQDVGEFTRQPDARTRLLPPMYHQAGDVTGVGA